MRRTRRRGATFLVALAVLLSLASAPVDALTLQRNWTARLGSNGSAGVVSLSAYTNGTGSARYTLKGLRVNATYAVQIRYGTCARLGSIAVRLTPIHTSAAGIVSRIDRVASTPTAWVWSAARSPAFAVRILNGTDARCGDFTFVHATRVAVSGLGIDLPIIRGPSGYPPCRVAMYHASVAQPREPGITFIFAHARTGMFLPLLTRWKIDRGASLIGRTVRVWTSDSYVSSYRIIKVRVTTNAMAGVTSLTRERLWLQTSTGPNTTYPKLIVEAARFSTVRTTYAASHPTPHPLGC
jgi:hypothetical protein